MHLRLKSCCQILLFATLASCAAAATDSAALPHASGPFAPTWASLADQYHAPDWFRDAKFGIWAHWGPQCEPEDGDWYARNMYIQGSPQNKFHVAHYGPPSQFGFKDVIHLWHAEHFDPDALLAFYKASGARYFMALANHHDNFDNFNSKYQPWNSVRIGPHKDLIGMWAAAARKNGLRFAVSVHAGRTWNWYEPAQGADKDGPLAGVPYDGRLTKADGAGKWWDGLDPQDLYAQNHAIGAPMSAAYCEKFYLRTKQLWDDYHPDQIYFDDPVAPLRKAGEQYALNLYAHFYNSSIALHGHNEAVVNAKHLDETQRHALVYDIERGKAEAILPQPWQTDTCIGHWHYDRALYERHGYKQASAVVPMLADIVSKNGNLMLSVPLRADGTLDADETKIVSDIGRWLKVNGDAIYATRPWTVYGEGPSTRTTERGRFGGLKDTQTEPYTAEDIRFTRSKDGRTVYAIVLAWPQDEKVTIRSLAAGSANWPGEVNRVSMLGAGPLKFTRDGTGLTVTFPEQKPCDIAYALRIE